MTLDTARWPGSPEDQQAQALGLIAQVLRDHHEPSIDTDEVRGQAAEVLQAVAIELNAGRGVPIGVRRAVVRLANGLRVALDPNDGPVEL